MGKFRIIREKFVDSVDRFTWPKIIYELEANILPNDADPDYAMAICGKDAFKNYNEAISCIMNAIHGRPVSCDIKDVIFNPPATIVLWEDGTKTVVKCHDEKFDVEKGLAMAIAKKALGNKGNYYNVFSKWTTYEPDEAAEEYEELPDQTPFVPIGHRRSDDKTSFGDNFKKAVRNLLNKEDNNND